MRPSGLNDVKVWMRWYYYPEESIGSGSQFHSASSCQTIMICKVLTPFMASFIVTLLRSAPSSRTWGLRIITFGDLCTRLLLEGSLPTGLLCITSVKCLINQIISCCNVKGSRASFILLAWI
ncbi:unnamed protein product [Fraxinus pennsylvanica]|uniref:Uncharacterized protein n=1 Tax=Fraxinus pennsylvanica TaxID=56036 RepID=A0AAD2AGQ5_9LAMI|nr:unnamed protein product [Fraxinus pennsylvanica]